MTAFLVVLFAITCVGLTVGLVAHLKAPSAFPWLTSDERWES